MITFRTGTRNPLTLYVASEPYGPHDGRDLPGWMTDGEWSIGWLPHEGLAALAVEAWNAFVCRACPWGCPSCSLNRATCECYEHQDRIDENGEPVEGSTPLESPATSAWEPPAEAEELRTILDLAERHASAIAEQWSTARLMQLVARDRAELADHLVPPKYADDPCECVERMTTFWRAAAVGGVVSVPPPIDGLEMGRARPPRGRRTGPPGPAEVHSARGSARRGEDPRAAGGSS